MGLVSDTNKCMYYVCNLYVAIFLNNMEMSRGFFETAELFVAILTAATCSIW